MTKAATSRRSAYWLHALVYFLLTFGAGYVPLSHLEPLGMSVMGIFLGLLYGWTFIGFIWPSMLSIFALGVCGFFPTPQAAFSNAFSNHLVIFMLLVLVFTAYCEKSGLNRKLSCWFLSRKIVVGRPWTFTFMVLLGSFVVSFLVDGNAVVFIAADKFLPLQQRHRHIKELIGIAYEKEGHDDRVDRDDCLHNRLLQCRKSRHLLFLSLIHI